MVVMKNFNLAAMKKIFYLITLAATITAMSVSCNKVEELENNGAEEKAAVKTLVFEIGDSETTKTVIGDDGGKKFAQWETGDVLGSITTKTAGSSPVNAASNPVTFSIASDGGLSAGNTINVWYPYGGSIQSNASAVSMSIPSLQTQNGSNFDFDAMPMVAETVTVTAGMESATDNTVVGTINFANLGSLIDFKVYSSNATYAEEKVLSVKYAANKAIAGNFTMNLTAVDFSDESTLALSGYNIRTVYTAMASPTSIGSTKETALDVYMVVAPGTYQGSVVVETDKALYTFPINSDKTLARSGLKSFGLNLGKDGLSRVANVASLDWESVTSSDTNGLGKDDFGDLTGVSVNAGSDYAAGNKPYLLKFDDTGRYIVVKVDNEIDNVTIKGKGFSAGSGSIYSSVTVQASNNGLEWSDVQTFNVNATSELNFETSNSFSASARFVRLYFTKAKNNFGIARVSISKPDTTPAIASTDIEDVPAIGVNDGASTYSVKNIADDVEVTDVECDGCVTSAMAGSGVILYEVGPNYTSSPETGHIFLWSASDHSITKTINVSQLASSLSVSAATVTIPAASGSASFTVTTPEMSYNAVVASVADGMNLSISSGASGSSSASAQTVTVASTTSAPTSGEPITLGTIDVYRNGNTGDPQKVTITIKKAVAGAVTYSYHKVTTVSEGRFLLVLNSKAISSFGKTLSSTAVTINNDKIASNALTTDTYAITIASDGSGYYTLKMGDNYIGYANDSDHKTDLVTSDTASTNYYKWNITIDNNAAYIVNVGTSTRYIGAATSAGDTYKAYATSNHASYPSPFLYKYMQD